MINMSIFMQVVCWVAFVAFLGVFVFVFAFRNRFYFPVWFIVTASVLSVLGSMLFLSMAVGYIVRPLIV